MLRRRKHSPRGPQQAGLKAQPWVPLVHETSGDWGSILRFETGTNHERQLRVELRDAKEARMKRFPTLALALIMLCGVTWLNLTGFCFSQLRYVSDDELIEKALTSDWREIMEIASQIYPD